MNRSTLAGREMGATKFLGDVSTFENEAEKGTSSDRSGLLSNWYRNGLDKSGSADRRGTS
jgi:hypothetical protein